MYFDYSLCSIRELSSPRHAPQCTPGILILWQGSRNLRKIRFGVPGIKADMTKKKKLVFGTVGTGVLGILLGGWQPVASGGMVMAADNSVQTEVRPEIDRATPRQTERAVFALG